MSAIFSQPVEITVSVPVTPVATNITLSVSPSSGNENTTFTATGKVTDQNGNPMSGVSVYLFFYAIPPFKTAQSRSYHTSSPTTTDNNGDFSTTFTGASLIQAMGITPSEYNLSSPGTVEFAVVASNQVTEEPNWTPLQYIHR